MPDRPYPFEDVQELFDRLTKQLESAARSWEMDVDNQSRLDLSTEQSGTSLDLADEGDALVVTVDVPGYDTDDLEIRLTGETLTITGERERTAEREDDDEIYLRRERRVASFSRHLRLPEPVDADGVHATVNNGVLTIHLPKLGGSGDVRTIEIDE
ncbi:Hsp20/alpha crystallin family protein [Natrarchaeobaculum sulfurireducens]|nr:Hsp20/alpha crystallin family protein [Natrarchaeobaculum sulfurireducens]AXR77765.1 Molecular chaperone (HSP20 family) [Natrarchaeobaculum sulfurireducens]